MLQHQLTQKLLRQCCPILKNILEIFLAAESKLKKPGRKNVTLMPMDVQELKFKYASFDNVMPSSVFCSVPDPIKGLKEISRKIEDNYSKDKDNI